MIRAPNVAQQTSASNYVYDLADRLISETTDGITTTYTYDSNGNRSHINGVLVDTQKFPDVFKLNTKLFVIVSNPQGSRLHASSKVLQAKAGGEGQLNIELKRSIIRRSRRGQKFRIQRGFIR